MHVFTFLKETITATIIQKQISPFILLPNWYFRTYILTLASPGGSGFKLGFVIVYNLKLFEQRYVEIKLICSIEKINICFSSTGVDANLYSRS
jgi:hypothetical protein